MSRPTWIPIRAITIIHEELIAEHGGSPGILDKGRLESTLARPQNLHLYEQETRLECLAACYGYGLVKNHCFRDANKRIALASIDVFLQMNGSELAASEPDAVTTILAVATDEMDQDALAEWVLANMKRGGILTPSS